jgi:hypothetical protein
MTELKIAKVMRERVPKPRVHLYLDLAGVEAVMLQVPVLIETCHYVRDVLVALGIGTILPLV